MAQNFDFDFERDLPKTDEFPLSWQSLGVFVPNANTIHHSSLRGDFLHHPRTIGHWVDPSCFALHSSRGYETLRCKAWNSVFSIEFSRENPSGVGLQESLSAERRRFCVPPSLPLTCWSFYQDHWDLPFFCWKCFRQTEKGALIDAEKTITE